MYPWRANGFGQFAATSYGPVSSSPPFCCGAAAVDQRPAPTIAASASAGARMLTSWAMSSERLVRSGEDRKSPCKVHRAGCTARQTIRPSSEVPFELAGVDDAQRRRNGRIGEPL